ncbi:MAG: sugar ABC transporter ATP-binding protein [Planctomycetota bacterium]
MEQMRAGEGATRMTGPLLEVHALRKAYGAVHALIGVDLQVRAGEVHALLGENGAGKSTLLKCLAGAVQADSGALRLDGAPYTPSGPGAARTARVAMIHQELALAPDLTVAENVVLGAEPRARGALGRLGWISAGQRRTIARAALERLGRAELNVDARVSALGPGERQMVEIARALAGDAQVLILDEPTSSLSAADVERLFAVLRALSAEGVAVVYVSHFLEEVRRVADVFTVLRDGATVGSGRLDAVSDADLVMLMAGRSVADLYPVVARTAGDVALELTDLQGPGGFPVASLELRRGEVFGIAGLVGAGRTELLRALYGLAPIQSGAVRLAAPTAPRSTSADRRLGLGRTPRARIAQGFGLLSEDRKGEGLALGLSLAVNATLSRLDTVGRAGWISRRRQRAAAERWFERLRVKRASPWQPAGSLSGGNQQKVALARLLHQGADLVLLDEPTRGVDVGARGDLSFDRRGSRPRAARC